MKRTPLGKYTRQFREEAARMVIERQLSIKQAAMELSLPESTLSTWVRQLKVGNLSEIGQTQKPWSELELELAQTKKQLAKANLEIEILKKAAAYFARESLPGTPS
jgi:transposase